MRVLHTSDWHIGRRFKGIDLLEYQRKALEWLIGLIKREQVDVLCVSGDVYDAPRPSAGAVRLFNEMFQRLGLMEVNGHPLHIIFTPGNHDSAARLGFAAALMLPNVHMRCDIADIATPIMVDSADGEQLAIYALPYLDPDLARPALQGLLNSADVLSSSAKVSDSAESDKRRETNTIRRSHEGVIRAALQLITADLAARRKANPKLNAMLMAHAFVSGATASDSERNITVGGVDSVPAELFFQFRPRLSGTRPPAQTTKNHHSHETDNRIAISSRPHSTGALQRIAARILILRIANAAGGRQRQKRGAT